MWCQKSLGRTLVNTALKGVELDGPGIDLGSKSDSASYYRFLKIKSPEQLLFSDLHPQSERVMKINLEEEIPCEDNSQNYLLLFNVLEHLYKGKRCLAECFRVLKPGGTLIGSVPFLVNVHRDPEDYYRYTDTTLKNMFEEAGFAEAEVSSLSYGPVSSGCSIFVPVFKYRILKSTIVLFSLFSDKMIHSFFGRNYLLDPEKYPLNYLFVARKAH